MNRAGHRTGPARRAAARLALAAAAAALAAGCATSTAGSGRVADDAAAPRAGSPTTLPLPPGSGTPAPGTPTAAPGGSPAAAGDVVAFGTLRMPLPAGATATVDGELLCVRLSGDTGCSLEVIDIGRVRAAGGSVSTPAPGEELGWWWGSDVPSCGTGDEVSAVARSTVVEKGFKKVGPKNAAYGSWLVTCEDSDQDFDPRLWWLPTSQLAFRERTTVAGTGEAVDKLLAGVTFGA